MATSITPPPGMTQDEAVLNMQRKRRFYNTSNLWGKFITFINTPQEF